MVQPAATLAFVVFVGLAIAGCLEGGRNDISGPLDQDGGARYSVQDAVPRNEPESDEGLYAAETKSGPEGDMVTSSRSDSDPAVFAVDLVERENQSPVLLVGGLNPRGGYTVSSLTGTYLYSGTVETAGDYPVPFLRSGVEYEVDWFIQEEEIVLANSARIVGTNMGQLPSRALENEEPRIYPGMKYWMDSGSWCTLGFMAWGASGELYALTAGHCALKPAGWIAHEVSFMDGTPFGSFVAGENDRTRDERDWALIRIDDDYLESASASVPRWGGPTRLLPENWGYGDPVCWYGQGEFYSRSETMHGRCGAFDAWYPTDDDEYGDFGSQRGQFWVDGDSDSGDSGSPVVHMESGAPVGTIIGSIEGVVGGEHPCVHFERAALQGFLLELATVSETTFGIDEFPVDIPIAGTIGFGVGYTSPGCLEDIVAWHGTHGPAN